jgi:hypothetical protein
MGKTGTSTELQGVQVVELVEYAGDGGDDTVAFSFDKQEVVSLEDVTGEDIPF